eukprot:TRINITY_DN13177_c0_g1_i2.p1 TRINITY_DN13177_c0_g1~~TRINITY_DN13177_c0_g1_i2.p1  ORF type:complete len:730 (-),score=158.55 TRINITY_DN13177_c0_g1_i2:70-2166(-)
MCIRDSCVSDGFSLAKILENQWGGVYTVSFTGVAAAQSQHDDHLKMKWWLYLLVMLPLVLWVVMMQLGSYRLLVIPLVTVPQVFSCCAACVSLLTSVLNIPEQELGLAWCSMAACCVNYIFFVLSKWQQERIALHDMNIQPPPDNNLAILAAQRSAVAVLTSTACMVLCWCALLFLPNQIQSIAAVMIPIHVISAVFCLCIPTAMLIAFQEFFEGSPLPRACCASEQEGASEEEPLLSKGITASRTCWRAIIDTISEKTWLQILQILIYTALVVYGSRPFWSDSNTYLVQPAVTTDDDFSAAQTYRNILPEFSSGVVQEQFGVTMKPSGAQGVQSQLFYQQICTLITELRQVPGVVLDNIHSVAWDRHTQQCITSYNPANEIQYTNFQQGSTLISFVSSFDSIGHDSYGFVGQARGAIQSAITKIKTYSAAAPEARLYGTIVSEVDARSYSSTWLPRVLTIAFLLMATIVGFGTGSIFAVFTMLWTVWILVVAVVGLAIMLYTDGGLNALNFDCFKSRGGILWSVPILAAMVLLSISLDYDLFMLSRILEIRKTKQFDNLKAISQGAAECAGVIASAGLVLAISFWWLFLLENSFSNQAGFILIVGVLFESQLVRSFVGSSMMSISSAFTFWPADLPDKDQLPEYSDPPPDDGERAKADSKPEAALAPVAAPAPAAIAPKQGPSRLSLIHISEPTRPY